MKKRIIACLLIVCMAAMLLPLTAFADFDEIFVDANYDGGESDGTMDNPYTDLVDVVENKASGGEIIVLMSDFELSGTLSIEKELLFVSAQNEPRTIRAADNFGSEGDPIIMVNSAGVGFKYLNLDGCGKASGVFVSAGCGISQCDDCRVWNTRYPEDVEATMWGGAVAFGTLAGALSVVKGGAFGNDVNVELTKDLDISSTIAVDNPGQNITISGGTEEGRLGIRYTGEGGELFSVGDNTRLTLRDINFIYGSAGGFANIGDGANLSVFNVDVETGKNDTLASELAGYVSAPYVCEYDNGCGRYCIHEDESLCVADVDGQKYASLEDAINAAHDGSNVNLMADVVLHAPINISKSLALNGNGFVISAAVDFEGAGLILVNGNWTKARFENLSLSGYYDAGDYTVKPNGICAEASLDRLEVDNVKFYGLDRPVYSKASFSGNNIELAGCDDGFYFENVGAEQINADFNNCNISVPISISSSGAGGVFLCTNGGSYHSINFLNPPATSDRLFAITLSGRYAFDPTNTTPEGYVCTPEAGGDSWVVTVGEASAAAKIGDKYYDNLDTAVNAVEDGETIELLNEIVLDRVLWLCNGKTFTIKGNYRAAPIFARWENFDNQGTGALVYICGGTNVTLEDVLLVGMGQVPHLILLDKNDGGNEENKDNTALTIDGGAFVAANDQFIRRNDDESILIRGGYFYAENVDYLEEYLADGVEFKYNSEEEAYMVTVKADARRVELVPDSGTVTIGETFTVGVFVRNAPEGGICGANVEFEYDTDVFTIEEVEVASVSGAYSDYNIEEEGVVSIGIARNDAFSMENGKIATVTFSVKPNIPEGEADFGITKCEISVPSDDQVVDGNFMSVDCTVEYHYREGDVNLDGNTDVNDALLVLKYVLNYKYDTFMQTETKYLKDVLDEANFKLIADANGDGSVSIIDVSYILRMVVK